MQLVDLISYNRGLNDVISSLISYQDIDSSSKVEAKYRLNRQEVNTSDLVGFLFELYQPNVRSVAAQTSTSLWEGRHWTVNGELEYDLKVRNMPFYGPKSNEIRPVAFTSYLSDDSRHILNNPAHRSQVYDLMEVILGESLAAAEQNMAVLSVVNQHLTELSSTYQQKLRQVFEPHQSKMSVDLDQFLAETPFLLLLRHPIASLYTTFQRRRGEGQRGYLTPANPDEISTELEKRLAKWQQTIDDQLTRISDLLVKAPVSENIQQQETVVSSLYLWDQIVDQTYVHQPADNPITFDPKQLFIFLAQELRKPKPIDNPSLED